MTSAIFAGRIGANDFGPPLGLAHLARLRCLEPFLCGRAERQTFNRRDGRKRLRAKNAPRGAVPRRFFARSLMFSACRHGSILHAADRSRERKSYN